jgi:hypothetical protein
LGQAEPDQDIEKAAKDLKAVETYQEMTFQATTIAVKSSDQHEVQGLLTIRRQTKPVTLIVQVTPREGEIRADGSGRLELSNFGLKPPKGLLGVSLFIGTKDEMTVLFGVLAKKQWEPTAYAPDSATPLAAERNLRDGFTLRN